MSNAPVQSCDRCKGAAGCTLPRESVKSSCKAFDAFEYFVPAILQGEIQKEGWENTVRTFGLCGDCGNRAGCVFVRREGGAWHCEEYC